MEHATQLPLARAGDEIVLDRYRLVRQLGSGGMGVVYLAHDSKLDRAVAVKRIPVDDPAVAKRAQREAKAAARLAHPAIVALYEAGTDDDAVYLVSELVRGRTLSRLMADGELSDRDVLEIGAALCDALAHAHSRGVVHRDVKPQNIIVPDDHGQGAGVVKLTDFGIAMLLGEDVLTRTGDIVGTIAYMAPEQAEGREVTAQADVYALGLVIYEALSGANPIRGRTPASTARRVGVRLPPLGRVRRDLPLELCVAIDRAVSPRPEDRGKVTALRAALRAHVDQAGEEAGTVAGGALAPVSRLAVPRPRHIDAWDDEPGTVRHPRSRVSAGARTISALAAGGLAAGALGWLHPADGVSPLAAGAGVAAVVAALPRLGWWAFLVTLSIWLAADGAPGDGVLVALAGVPAGLFLLRASPAWLSASALAPLLGLVGAAGAWPAVAGQARGVMHRAALGALGAWWLILAELLSGRTLLLGTPPEVRARALWDGSAPHALAHGVWPLFTSGAVGVALVWAAGAAVLPFIVRGRVAVLDMVAATVWAAALASGTQYVARAVAWDGASAHPRGLVVGAVAAGLLAVAATASRPVS